MAAKRRRWMPTEQQIAEAAKLYALGLTLPRVAAYFEVSEDMLRHAMKKNATLRSALEKAASKAIGDVSRSAYEMAISKKHPAMTIFYLKVRGRWKEPPREIEIDNKQKGLLDEPDQSKIKRAEEVVEEFKGLLEELKRPPKPEARPADAGPLLSKSGAPQVPADETGGE